MWDNSLGDIALVMAVQTNLFGAYYTTFYCKEIIYASMPEVDDVSKVTWTWTIRETGREPPCTLCQDASAFSITLLMFAIAASDVNLDGKLSESSIDAIVCFTGLCDKDRRNMEAIW